ncbi:TIGR03668 family PPOX class F420-dependent oxidoreductase [Halobacteriales archaeon QS_1_68_17]|nr:MAG: TIGR03668 family PPOX class F420-dependent oxidoreductase [Halobacteriales archaeon QS_1_68_17]
MCFAEDERAFVESARVGRLATADADGRPHAVPICYALAGERVVTPIDEKPKSVGPSRLRRVRDVRENPTVALVVDRYADDWTRLGWVQIRGRASLLDPGEDGHADAVARLRAKYDQYANHDLEARPVIEIRPGSVRSWGDLAPFD